MVQDHIYWQVVKKYQLRCVEKLDNGCPRRKKQVNLTAQLIYISDIRQCDFAIANSTLYVRSVENNSQSQLWSSDVNLATQLILYF